MFRRMIFVIFIVLLGISLTTNVLSQSSDDNEIVKSPLLRSSGPKSKTGLNKRGYAYLEMDYKSYQNLKQKVRSKSVRSISNFPLYADRSATISNIKEVENFVEQTVVYHGDQRIHQAPNLISLTGKVAETGDAIFLTLTPRGVYGYTKPTSDEPGRIIEYSPKIKYTVSYDASEEDIPEDWDLANDMVEVPGVSDIVFSEPLPDRKSDDLLYLRIAVDTTADFLDRFDGDTEAAEDYIHSMFDRINPAYNELGVHLVVSYLRLWPNGGDGYVGTGRGLMAGVESRWDPFRLDVVWIERHVAVLMHNRGGASYGGYGFATAAFSGNLLHHQKILAHELGHALGAHHSWSPVYNIPGATQTDPCTIMSYCWDTSDPNFLTLHPIIRERLKYSITVRVNNRPDISVTHPDTTPSCERTCSEFGLNGGECNATNWICMSGGCARQIVRCPTRSK